MVVERVATRRALEEFLAVRPDGAAALERRLDPLEEPFWEHAERELFLLRDGRRVVGRIGAVVNRAHDRAHGGGVGFFAWLACPNSLEAARRLVEAASAWLRGRGYTTMRGPLHLGTGEDLGLLVEGFDKPADPLVPWNEPWVPRLLDQLGFVSVHERHAYAWFADEGPAPPASLRAGSQQASGQGAGQGAGKTAGQPGGPTVRYRPLDRANLDAEARRFLATYNAAYASRWDFVPLTFAEARARLKDILRYADVRLVWLAEVAGEPAGVVVALPVRRERADSSQKLAALRALRAALRDQRVDRVHLVSVAVEPRHQGLHIGGQLLLRVWRAALDLGAREAEISGIDPDDQAMHHLLWRLGCRRIRRLRVYDLVTPQEPTGPSNGTKENA